MKKNLWWCLLLSSLTLLTLGCTRTVYVVQNSDGSYTEIEPVMKKSEVAPPDVDGASLTDGVTLSVLTSNDFVLAADGSAPLYVQVGLEALEMPNIAVNQRASLHLAIVLDRSGSMSAGKMEDARRAASDMVDALRDGDTVALVSYASDVRVDLPPTRLTSENRRAIHGIISTIHSGGGTYLSGGLETGAHQLDAVLDSEVISRVILLSDGNANEGIVDIPSLRMMSDRVREAGITITTMGIGYDYNEDTMAAVARSGGGNYYFIEDSQQIAGIFDEELRTLGDTVVRDAELHLELPEGVEVREIHGFRYEQRGRELVVFAGALSSGQQRRVLMEVDVPTDAGPSLTVARGHLAFRDERNRSERSVALPDITVGVTDSAETVSAHLNQPVVEKIERVQNARLREQVMERLDHGDRMGAQALVTKRLDQGRAMQMRFESDALDAEVEALESLAGEVENAPSAGSREYKKMRKTRLEESFDMVVD